MEKLMSEEKYKRTKKTLGIMGMVIMIAGVLLGTLLIVLGVNKSNNNKSEIAKLKDEIAAIEDEKRIIDQQKSEECMQNGFSTHYYELDRQSARKSDQIFAKREEVLDLEKAAPGFQIGGGTIIMFSLFIGVGLIIITKRREIAGYMIQDTAPIVEEGINTFSPMVGKGVGNIVKGVKQGWNAADDESENNNKKQ